ncbi:MAG: lipoprotein-releasing ABC transporter permease subunit [Pseudomonadota bacterium]
MPAMMRSVEWFVGLRYLRAKRRTRFVSFISGISLAGIALGVAALIVILSVMNGLEADIRDRLLSMTAHGRIADTSGQVAGWQGLRDTMLTDDGVVAAAPVVELEGMLRADRQLRPVLFNGVVPELEEAVSGRNMNFLAGGLVDLRPGERGILIGRFLALDLGARVGDGVLLLVPRPGVGGSIDPVLRRFVVRGVFEAGVQEHDSSLALLHAGDAQELLELDDAVTAVRFLTDDVMDAPRVALRLTDTLGGSTVSSDWTVENASYFRAIRLEKMMISLIVSLVIGVAAFNIVATLVMVVTDKTSEIAILRTLGLEPGGVVRVFFIQGAIIGWLGVLIGVAVGVVLAINVPVIVPALERALGFQIMPGDVYYVSQIPSILNGRDVLTIGLGALLLTSLATLYPARRAALVQPAAALRYE